MFHNFYHEFDDDSTYIVQCLKARFYDGQLFETDVLFQQQT